LAILAALLVFHRIGFPLGVKNTAERKIKGHASGVLGARVMGTSGYNATSAS